MVIQSRISRRTLVRGVGLLAAGAAIPILTACGAAATPTPAPAAKPAAPAAPAAAAPTAAPAAGAATPAAAAKPAAPAAGAATPAAAPATKPAAAPAAAAPDKPYISGKFNVWFSANWNKVTDEAIGSTFVDWGKQNGIDVEWQSIPGSPQILAKESASVAAGQPPELTSNNRVYWYTQGELADLTELVGKFKDQAGGMYPIAISSVTAPDGGLTGAPYAVDVWPVHWREDLIKPKLGGRYFESWDELIDVGPSIQTPPRNYLFAFALGHEGDHVNNIVNVLWDFGGRLNDEQGVPDIKNPANQAGIDVIVRMWKARLIPPDSFAQTVTSWNNETYQKSHGLMAINPATIMGWLLVNDKELGEKTGLLGTPKGSVGSHTEGAAIGFNYFKKSRMVEHAPSALEYFLQPPSLQKISESVQGRFVPVYRDHTKNDFWQTSKFAEMKRIAEAGRVRNWPAPQQPWLSDVTDAKYTLSDMMHKIINENMPVQQAQDWAQNEMMDSYNRFRPRS
jgi:hypothetical protein